MTSENYYDRNSLTHLDGTRIFKTPHDERNEREVAAELQNAWECKILNFGDLSPIDWYATRHGRLVGVVELKSRTHTTDKYPTVFLNMRKWLALQLASVGAGVPAIFVVRFTDAILWIPISQIDASAVAMRGCRTHVKSVNDVEPVIEVPVANMYDLHQWSEF